MNGTLIIRFKEGGERVFTSEEWLSHSVDRENETVKVLLPDKTIEHFLLLNIRTIDIEY